MSCGVAPYWSASARHRALEYFSYRSCDMDPGDLLSTVKAIFVLPVAFLHIRCVRFMHAISSSLRSSSVIGGLLMVASSGVNGSWLISSLFRTCSLPPSVPLPYRGWLSCRWAASKSVKRIFTVGVGLSSTRVMSFLAFAIFVTVFAPSATWSTALRSNPLPLVSPDGSSSGVSLCFSP